MCVCVDAKQATTMFMQLKHDPSLDCALFYAVIVCAYICIYIYIYIHWANNVEYAYKSNKSGTIGIIYLSQTAEVSVRCETVLNCLGLKAWPGRSTWSRCSFGGVPLTEHKEGSGCFEGLLLL